MGSPGDKSRGNLGTSMDAGRIVQVKDGLAWEEQVEVGFGSGADNI